jgi:hypothetical protein
MTNTNQLGRGGKQGAILGQAGVYAVASQLCLKGHAPLFPSVDYGVDLMIESGLRLQVKVAHITYPTTANYPMGAYCFNLRRSARVRDNQGWKRCDMRTYEGVADFFVLWGIDENRFWIVPTSLKQSHIWFSRLGSVNRSRNAALFDHVSAQRAMEMENRWDLLDVNAVKNLVDDVSPVEVKEKP